MIYFDHCASTPPFDEVIDAVVEVMKRYYGNPSSIHHLGVEAERLMIKAREVIAKSLNMTPDQLIFTSGGTESNNLAIKGVANQFKTRGNHLITTTIEHSSVYECFQQLEQEGFRVTYLPVDETGRISIIDLEQAISSETILVSIMQVNNEVGSIQPIKQAAQILKKTPRIQFHVDAVQSVGKLAMDTAAWGIDLLSISAHKIRGPKGIGLLFCREGLELYPLIVGGGQERGFRSGTENVPLIVGMAKAIRMTIDTQRVDQAYLYHLRKKLMDYLDEIPELILNSPRDKEAAAPHIVNFSFPGMKSEVVVHALETHRVMISTRSACSSGEQRPSRVLQAMGLDRSRSISGLRISLSPMHSEEDIKYLYEQIQQVVDELKN
jgi:cysteine desulfurase